MILLLREQTQSGAQRCTERKAPDSLRDGSSGLMAVAVSYRNPYWCGLFLFVLACWDSFWQDSKNRPSKPESVLPLDAKGALVLSDEKRRKRVSNRRFDFDQAIFSAQIERVNVIACPIPVFLRSPPQSLGEIDTPSSYEVPTLMLENNCFPTLAQFSISGISFGRIELSY